MDKLTTGSIGNAEVLARIKNLVNKTYQAKIEADEAAALFSKYKQELTNVMEAAQIDKFVADEATATCKLKSSVTVPKDIISKRNVFNYIKKNYGEIVLEEMLTINPSSFSSWYNAEVQKKIEEGDLDFRIEGLKPYEYYSVGLTKRNK